MIEDCAPRLAQNTGAWSLDEAVSLMGAVLPQLERWRTVQENEERYGRRSPEALRRRGDRRSKRSTAGHGPRDMERHEGT